jgi:ABC-type transport system involved in multi-copper enzyme maturation permease subunit
MGTADEPTFLLDQKWPFRIALAGWLAVGIGAWFLADELGRPGQVILASLWLVGLGLILRQFLLSLFGPVLAYDVLRVGRKSRYIWFRVAYAVILALMLTWVYFAWYEVARYRGSGQIRPKDLAQLAETYFTVYMVVQFILVCVLTPASVAGSIADEKERRTLEFMLATDLRDREIIFGKLASRVGSMILFLLAGLPILALMQFFGGIDPDLVLAGFSATVLIVISLAALSIAASVLSRKARDAIALTYLAAVAYVVVSGVIYVLSLSPYAMSSPLEIFGYRIAWSDATYPLIAGNPFFMVPMVIERRMTSTSMDLFTALRHFALFHMVFIAVLVSWAGLRLRSIALQQTFGGTRQSLLRWLVSRRSGQKKGKGTPVQRGRVAVVKSSRPSVGDSPILWKEVFVDVGLRLGGFGKVIILGLIVLSFVPIGFIFWFALIDESAWGPHGMAARWQYFGEGMRHYLQAAGTVAATLVFLAVTIRGSSALSGERDRHTMDVLLTTPLSAKTIIWGKWWGCILGMRWAWAWIFAMWVLVLASGGIHPIMFVAAVISLAIYASGFAWIGLFCSLHMRTTLRSTMVALVLALFAGGGYFLIFLMCCVLPLSFSTQAGGNDFELFLDFLCSFSPPVNLAWLPIEDFSAAPDGGVNRQLRLFSRQLPYVQFWLLGLAAWGLLSFLLSQRCIAKFRQMANRIAMFPERDPRPRMGPPPLPKPRRHRGDEFE